MTLDTTTEMPLLGQGDLFTRLFRHVAPDATNLVLIRHGEAAPIDEDSPRYDPPLSEKGRWQAQQLARRLAGDTVHALYSSPLRRARETAEAVSQATGLPLEIAPDLREVDIDVARLRTSFASADRETVVRDLGRRLLSCPRWDVMPGFEPSHRFRLRVLHALKGIVERHPGETVAVVCHGGVINVYLSTILDIPRDIFFLPQHASLTLVRTNGLWAAVQTVGDCAHLQGEVGGIFTWA